MSHFRIPPSPVWTALFIVLSIHFSSLASVSGSSLDGTQPNIVFILTDDQGYGDLSWSGHPYLKTPHLDALAKSSTVFTDFQVSPTCAPTRAALMSGRTPFKVGVTHTVLERERMALGVKTIADVLADTGYKNGIFGKWHLGEEEPYLPNQRGFHEEFIHGAGGIGQNFPGSQSDVPGNKYFDPVVRHNGTFVQTEGFCTDIFFDQALSWIYANKEEPFFAFIPTNAPHSPFIAPETYKTPFEDYTQEEKERSFFGMIVNIDDNVGKLMDRLRSWGLMENTLVIFMSDNGTALGNKIYNAGMKGKKSSVDEGGTRVPFFMHLPGKIKAGQSVDRLTRHYDIFPTLASLAGADISNIEGLDGRSLLPLVDDPNASWEDRYTFFHRGRWNKAGVEGRWGRTPNTPEAVKYKGFAVRNERWRLVGKRALYDIIEDPGQERNVLKDHPEVVATILNVYENWWTDVRPFLINEDASLDVPKPFREQYEKQKAGGNIPTWQASYPKE